MEKQEIKLRKLIAEEGKILVSKSTHYDEETKQEIPDIKSKIVYLGKNDTEDNYVEIEEFAEEEQVAEDNVEEVENTEEVQANENTEEKQ
jgi:hypothetical protein